MDSPGTKGPVGAKVWRQEKACSVGDSSGDLNLGVVRKGLDWKVKQEAPLYWDVENMLFLLWSLQKLQEAGSINTALNTMNVRKWLAQGSQGQEATRAGIQSRIPEPVLFPCKCCFPDSF